MSRLLTALLRWSPRFRTFVEAAVRRLRPERHIHSRDERYDQGWERGFEDNDREWICDLAELVDLDPGFVGREEIVQAVREFPIGGRSEQEKEARREAREARDVAATAQARLDKYTRRYGFDAMGDT